MHSNFSVIIGNLWLGLEMIVAVHPSGRLNSRALRLVLHVDYASCRKHGISYRALPSCYEQPVCSGRNLPGNEVCNEVRIC